MKRHGQILLFASIVCLFATVALWGSSDRGIIQGTVTDPQGAVIPKVEVLVQNVETGVEIHLATNSVGFYLAPELVPGKYRVRFQSAGFSTLEVKEVVAIAGSITTTNAEMKVGEPTQSVEVTAAPPLLETTSSNFTTSLSSQLIQEIPLQGRDIQTLVQLLPGVIQSSGPSGAAFGSNSQFGGMSDPMHYVGSSISVNGSQAGANSWYLEGALNSSVGAENVVVNPSPDAVAEFNLVSNGLAAEYGKTSGAIVNVVMKSGTNNFHGNLYGFNRNSFFSASNPFARRDSNGTPLLSPRVNYNVLGGTIGGPVILPGYNGKNRTFFFGSWDISFFHQNQNRLLTVPLPAERHGDFSHDPRIASVCDPANGVTNCLYDPFTNSGPDANGYIQRQPFATPIIPENRIDPLAKFYLDSYPNPNYLDPLQQGLCGNTCNNFLGPVGSSLTTHNILTKIDHVINDKNKLFVTWMYNPSYYTNFRYPWNGPSAPLNTGVAGAQPYDTKNQLAIIGLTSTIGSTIINEARFSFSRQSLISKANSEDVTQTETVKQKVKGLNFYLFDPLQPVPNINFGDSYNYYSLGPAQWQNTVQGQQAYTASDNLTKVIGRHTLKTGLSFRRNNLWNSQAAYGYNINFDGWSTADPVTGLGGSGLATFLLGWVGQSLYEGGASTGVQYSPWQTNDEWGAYGQDEFRIKPNLTVSIGLRYDVMGWIRERHNALANINFDETNPEAPAFKGRLEYMGSSMHPDRNLFPANKNSFGPRFGFSWSPGGSGKTVIRGGYGMVYSNSMSALFGQGLGAVSTPGFSFPVQVPRTDASGVTPLFILSQGAPAPLAVPDLAENQKNQAQLLGRQMMPFLKASHDPAVQQWSFFLQRELPGNMMISAGYAGSHGTHLFGDELENIDVAPTKTWQSLRSQMYGAVPGDPSLDKIYGWCGTDSATGKSQCPGWLTLTPYPQYYGISPLLWPDGTNKYHSAQFRIEKRPTHGLNFLVAYTISKNIVSAGLGAMVANSTGPTTIGKGVGRIAYIPGAAGGGVADGSTHTWSNDPSNRRSGYSLSPDDTPQVFNVAVTYELPFGQGKRFINGKGLANAIFGGWKWTQNWNAQSGVPMFFRQFYNYQGGIWTNRLNLVGDPSAGRSGKTRQQLEQQYYNPAAFTPPYGIDDALVTALSTGTYADGTTVDYDKVDSWWQWGNAGIRPNGGRTPGYWNADMSLGKSFKISESRIFNFRWDVFNAFNHQNLGIPDNRWCLPPKADGTTDLVHIFDCEFGRITNVQTDPRSMQFSVKFQW